ncbi:hypothetical protein JHJ32_05395 [Parapedobacter sp. ISTM3]|uniref:Iron complex transport system substrate-binding protein n=1 Tax=Parapedobacter luteus TaxID=623280 RepID=A0A1T5BM29_9SPHI|nr:MULTISPECIES: hypothetical protein [Parapedobacter]MBK1439414.1 hypothetical protein [Parapedobacter sp. ISTM3]SKB48331.1 iron complex transport system substrate-binding protein [Parapedobacter luteus]
MQNPRLSLQSVLTALNLDSACTPLIEQAPLYEKLIHAVTPQSVYAAIREIGETLNVQQPANQMAEDLEERIDIIIHKLKFIANDNKPRVLALYDVHPLKIAHNEYLASLVQICAGISYPGDITASIWNPDIIIVINDKPMPRLLDELPATFSDPAWRQVNALANNQVYIVHNSNYLHQPGALIADDAEILAEIIHPKYFVFGRDEDAWMRFEWQ